MKRRAWKPLAGSVQENAIIRELRVAVDAGDALNERQQREIERLANSIPRLGKIQNALTDRGHEIQRVEATLEEGVREFEVGLGAAAPDTACGWLSGGTAVDVDTRVRITRLRFYLQTPAVNALYRVECWKVTGLTLVERVAWVDSTPITTQATPDGHWAEAVVYWDLEPGQRYGFVVSRVGGGNVVLALSSDVAPEYVPGLGQVVTGHFHTNDPITAGLTLSDNSDYRARFTLFTEGEVPPHSHEMGDIKGLGFEAHFSYQGDLAVAEGTQRLYNATDQTRTIRSVSASVGAAPAGSAVLVDVNLDGSTIFTTQSARPTIEAGANLGVGVPAAQAWPPGSYLTVDIDQIGDTPPGADLTVAVMYL